MTTLEDNRIWLDLESSNLAFRAGQFLERRLVDRGIERTRSSESSVVRADAIRTCMDESLLEELRTFLNERTEQESRNAA